MKLLRFTADLLRRFGGTRRADAGAYFHSAILLAGGTGSRMGSGTPKQFLPLGSKQIPVIVHTLLRFQNCPYIKEIILVARGEDAPLYDAYRKQYRLRKLVKIVEGGGTRQESAALGFFHIDKRAEYVSIHDGVRCLLTEESLEAVIRTAYLERTGAAAAAPSKDTVKLADAQGFVTSTPNRANVWLVQTPQTFPVSQYQAALAVAKRDGLFVTDDCALAEHAGFSVKLVDCGYENLKLTTKEDLELAEAILRRREATV